MDKGNPKRGFEIFQRRNLYNIILDSSDLDDVGEIVDYVNKNYQKIDNVTIIEGSLQRITEFCENLKQSVLLTLPFHVIISKEFEEVVRKNSFINALNVVNELFQTCQTTPAAFLNLKRLGLHTDFVNVSLNMLPLLEEFDFTCAASASNAKPLYENVFCLMRLGKLKIISFDFSKATEEIYTTFFSTLSYGDVKEIRLKYFNPNMIPCACTDWVS